MSESTDHGNGNEKEPELTTAQISESFLTAQAVPVWGGGVTGDFFNIVGVLAMQANDPDMWKMIKPRRTIEQYVEYNYPDPKDQEVRDLIAAGINKEFLSKANVIISEINAIIGNGVTTQAQADELLKKKEAFSDLVYRRIG